MKTNLFALAAFAAISSLAHAQEGSRKPAEQAPVSGETGIFGLPTVFFEPTEMVKAALEPRCLTCESEKAEGFKVYSRFGISIRAIEEPVTMDESKLGLTYKKTTKHVIFDIEMEADARAALYPIIKEKGRHAEDVYSAVNAGMREAYAALKSRELGRKVPVSAIPPFPRELVQKQVDLVVEQSLTLGDALDAGANKLNFGAKVGPVSGRVGKMLPLHYDEKSIGDLHPFRSRAAVRFMAEPIKGVAGYAEVFNTNRVQAVEDPIRGNAVAFTQESFHASLGYKPNGHEFGVATDTALGKTVTFKGKRRDSDYWGTSYLKEFDSGRIAFQGSKENLRGETGMGEGGIVRLNFEVEKTFRNKLRLGQQLYRRDPAQGVNMSGFTSSRTEIGYKLKPRSLFGFDLRNELTGGYIYKAGDEDDQAAFVGMKMNITRE